MIVDMKRSYWTPGNVILISLNDGKYAYGRVVGFPLMAFYSLHSDEVLPIEEIIKSDVIFKIWVMKYAIGKHHWKVLGNIALEDELKTPVEFYIWDCIAEKFNIYQDDGKEQLVTLEECDDLECAAVWDPEHVESRLADHFAGRENEEVYSLKATTQLERALKSKRT